MEGQMHRGGWIRWTNRWAGLEGLDIWMDELMNKWMNGWMDRQVEGWMDEEMEGSMD